MRLIRIQHLTFQMTLITQWWEDSRGWDGAKGDGDPDEAMK